MLEFNNSDRDKWARKGFKTLYALLCSYKDKILLKIGRTSNASVLGRLAWNTYANEGYHIFGFRGGIYEDEKDRVKITEVVTVEKIIDEVQIKGSNEFVEGYEKAFRSLFKSYSFKENFSGKTEYVEVEENTIDEVKECFKDIRKKLICN